MKKLLSAAAKILPPLLSVALLSLSSARAQETLITETATEFTAAADFDGDGVLDAVVVDKATGQYRLGFTGTSGVPLWEVTRSSGLLNLTGFTTGPLLDREPGSPLLALTGTNRADVAFANPQANRINVFNAAPGVPNPQPVAAYPLGIGPSMVIAADVGGPGNTTILDLMATSGLNNAPTATWAGLLRNSNDTFSATSLAPVPFTTPYSRGNRVTPRTNSAATFVTVLTRQPGAGRVELLDLSFGNFQLQATLNGLPDAAEYTAGFFSNRAWLTFLIHEPGTTNPVAVFPLAEPAPGVFVFPPAPTLRFGFSSNVVERVQVIRSATRGGQLVVLLNGGREARILNFDGVNPPVPVETLIAPASAPFTAVIGTGPDTLQLLAGTGGLSQTYQTRRWNGASYALIQTGILPPLSRSAPGATLAQFRAEPFVVPQPVLLGLARVSDWASTPVFQNNGLGLAAVRVVQAVGEAFRDAQHGLGIPAPVSVPALPGAAFALPSQYRETIAIATLTPAQGAVVSELSVSPPAGTYTSGVCPALATTVPTDIIMYRLDGGPWFRYAGPPALYRSALLEAYSEPAGAGSGGPRSALLSARYEITTPWTAVDTDGDGVPDFVEVNHGLNPKAGADTDGDGFSDLDELLAGTDPSRTNSVPGTNHLAQSLTFPAHLSITPQPHLIPLPGFGAAEGTPVGLRQLTGALIAEVPTLKDPATLPLLTRASAEFELRLTSGSLLTVATPEHFTTSPDRPLIGEPSGFELLAILPAPAGLIGSVPYVATGQSDAIQAAAWLLSAQNYLATNPPPRLANTIQPLDVLIAALFERKIDTLVPSNLWKRTVPLTFFPHRSHDAHRTNPPLAVLQAITSPARSNSWNLRSLLLQVDELARGLTNRPTLDLRLLTAELYRVGTYSNLTTLTNLTGGTTNILKVTTFPPLLDELRRLLETGMVSSNYAAQPTITTALLASAAQGARDILAAVQPRPRTVLELVVLPDSFSGDCTVLAGTGGSRVALSDRFRRNFALDATFDALLLPGSHVRVAGFTDLPIPLCADQALEVVSFTLLDVPAPALTDSDADGLPDEWERTFFGDLGAATGSGDNDLDGFSNRDELRAGTDPANAASHPAGTPAARRMAANGVPATETGAANADATESGDLAVDTDGSGDAGVELDGGAAEGISVGVDDPGTNAPVAAARGVVHTAASGPLSRLTLTILGTLPDATRTNVLTVRLERSGTELVIASDSSQQGGRSNTFLLLGSRARVLGQVTLPHGASLRLRDQTVVSFNAASGRAGPARAGVLGNFARALANAAGSILQTAGSVATSVAGAVLEVAEEAVDEAGDAVSGEDCDDPNECGGGTGTGGTGDGSSKQKLPPRIADFAGRSISNIVTVMIVPADATLGAVAVNRLRLTTPDAASFRIIHAGLISEGFTYGASGGARIRGLAAAGKPFGFATEPPEDAAVSASARQAAPAAGTADGGLSIRRGFGTEAVLEQLDEQRGNGMAAKWELSEYDAILEGRESAHGFSPQSLNSGTVTHRWDGTVRNKPVTTSITLSAKGGGEVSMEELSFGVQARRVLVVTLDSDGVETGRQLSGGGLIGSFRGGQSLVGFRAPVPLAGHPTPGLQRIFSFDGPMTFQPAAGGPITTGQVFVVRTEFRFPLTFPSRPTAALRWSSTLNQTNHFQPAVREDWGDAPSRYPTLAAKNGARHTLIRGLRLGRRVDADLNGAPHPFALGDDLLGVDDEDGVGLNSVLNPGSSASLSVRVRSTSGPARLDAFIDFNADGDWLDAGEKIFNSLVVSNGVNLLTFAIPATAVRTNTYARFRLSRAGGLGPEGAAPDGEVEDYRIRIGASATPLRLAGLEFDGDCRPAVKLNSIPGADGILTLESVTDLGATEWIPESQPTPAGEASAGLEGQIKGSSRRFFRVRTE